MGWSDVWDVGKNILFGGANERGQRSGGLVGSFTGGIAGGLASGASGALNDKIYGIPQGKTAEQLGNDAYTFAEKAHPGTNPWERMGAANPAGQMGAASLQAKTQTKLQRAQLGSIATQGAAERQNKLQIAGIAADTARATSNISRSGSADGQTPDAMFRAQVGNLTAQKLLTLQKKITEIPTGDIKKLEAEFWALLKVYGLAAAGALGFTKALSVVMGKIKKKSTPQRRSTDSTRRKTDLPPQGIPRGNAAPRGRVTSIPLTAAATATGAGVYASRKNYPNRRKPSTESTVVSRAMARWREKVFGKPK